MSYGEDCYAADEAQRKADDLQKQVWRLEEDIEAMRRDHDQEIRDLWARIQEMPGAV